MYFESKDIAEAMASGVARSSLLLLFSALLTTMPNWCRHWSLLSLLSLSLVEEVGGGGGGGR